MHQVESDVPDEDIISASVVGIQPQAAESPSPCRIVPNGNTMVGGTVQKSLLTLATELAEYPTP